MTDCVFCKIVKGKLPSTKEVETDNVLAIANIAPVAEHHILIIPKKHIASVGGVKKGHSEIIMDMFEVVKKLVKDKKVDDGYKLIFNAGKYQSVPHLHWHMLAGKLEDEDDVLNKT